MGKYKKFVIPVIVLIIFTVIAILLSIYILSLPISQITEEGCNGFSDYQLANCIAFYQRQGDLGVLQQHALLILCLLWIGLLIGSVCSFFVFPRVSLSGNRKVNVLLLGLLSALLIAGLPLVLFPELIINGFILALSFVISFVTLELVLVSSKKEVVATKEPVSSMRYNDIQSEFPTN